MKAAYDDHDLRLLLDGWVIPGQCDARDLPAAFRTAVAALAEEGVEYAVVGELALARYVRARFTDVIALRLLSSDRAAQAQSRIEAATRLISATSTVRCDLCVVTSPIERAFVLDAPVIDWLGAHAALATPEHLLWLALSSDLLTDDADAIHLLQSDHIDRAGLYRACRGADPRFLRRFSRLWRRAESTRESNYSRSVEQRLAARARKLTEGPR